VDPLGLAEITVTVGGEQVTLDVPSHVHPGDVPVWLNREIGRISDAQRSAAEADFQAARLRLRANGGDPVAAAREARMRQDAMSARASAGLNAESHQLTDTELAAGEAFLSPSGQVAKSVWNLVDFVRPAPDDAIRGIVAIKDAWADPEFTWKGTLLYTVGGSLLLALGVLDTVDVVPDPSDVGQRALRTALNNGDGYRADTPTIEARARQDALLDMNALDAELSDHDRDFYLSNPSQYGIVAPGPYATESIPARSSSRSFTQDERAAIDRIGRQYGCHSCGTKDSGTSSGHFVPDHQPPSHLFSPGSQQRLYPHCIHCSRTQGLALSRSGRTK